MCALNPGRRGRIVWGPEWTCSLVIRDVQIRTMTFFSLVRVAKHLNVCSISAISDGGGIALSKTENRRLFGGYLLGRTN